MSISVRFRIALYSGLALVVASSLLAAFTYYGTKQMASQLVASTLTESLNGQIRSFDVHVESIYGALSYVDGVLVDESGQSIEGNHALVDAIGERTGMIATVFIRDGDDFRRITTTVKKPDGSRAVGTMLGKGSQAYQPIVDGRLYLGEAAILGERYLTAYDPLFDDGGRIVGIKFLGVTVADAEAIVSRELRSLLTRLLGIFLVVAAVALALIYLLAGMIVAPVVRASAMLKDIAEGGGDLTQRLAIERADEIGDLGHWFDVFVENIQSIVKKVVGNSAQVEGQSMELAEIASRLRDGAGKTAERSVSVAAASEEMSATMSSVSAAIEHASSNMGAVSSASGEDDVDHQRDCAECEFRAADHRTGREPGAVRDVEGARSRRGGPGDRHLYGDDFAHRRADKTPVFERHDRICNCR